MTPQEKLDRSKARLTQLERQFAAAGVLGQRKAPPVRAVYRRETWRHRWSSHLEKVCSANRPSNTIKTPSAPKPMMCIKSAIRTSSADSLLFSHAFNG